jgi:hypothetical protein
MELLHDVLVITTLLELGDKVLNDLAYVLDFNETVLQPFANLSQAGLVWGACRDLSAWCTKHMYHVLHILCH